MKKIIRHLLSIVLWISALCVRAQEIPHSQNHDTIHIEEITISSNRERTLRRQAPSLVDIATLKTMNSTNSVCLAQTLDFVSGVRVEDNCQNCGFTQVRINGLDGHYSQILIDSKPIFSSLSGVYGLEQIPVEMIDRIEVMRGGGSALYGASAVGGIINVITKEANSNGGGIGHTITNINLANAFDNVTHAYASAVTKNNAAGLYLFAQNRHRNAYDHNDDGYSDIPKLNNLSLGFNAFVRPTKLSKLSIRYNYISDEHRGGNKLDLQPHMSDISEGAFHFIHSGNIDYHIDFGHQHVETYIALQNVKRDSYYGGCMEGGEEEKADALKSYGYTHNLTLSTGGLWRFHFDTLWFMPASLTVGAEYNFDMLSDSIPGHGQYLQQNVNIAGLYAQNEWKNEKWSLLAGVRADKHSLISRIIVSPRVNIRYNPIRNLSLRVNYAMGFRPPQNYDEDLHVMLADGERIVSRLADGLREERSHSASVSADYCMNRGGVDADFTTELFYTFLNDIFAERRYEAADGVEVSERYNADKGYVAGVHQAIKISWRRYMMLQVGATWQISRYNSPIQWSDEAAPEIRMLRTPQVYGYFIAESNPWKKLTLNLSGNLTGPMLVPHEAEISSLTKSQTFFVLNAQVSYEFGVKLSKNNSENQRDIFNIQVSLGVNNITNSYQKDLDVGVMRDSGYIYGPKMPRCFFVGVKLRGRD